MEELTPFLQTLPSQIPPPHIVKQTKFRYILGSPKTKQLGNQVKHLLILLSILLLSSPLFGQKETKVVEKMRMFVSVGDPGTILTSSDGNSWTQRNSGISKYLYGVTSSQ